MTDPGSYTHWYVAQLKPNGASRAVANLQRQNVATFMPKHRETVRRGNKLVTRDAPLFPGYLFVRAVQHDAWRKVNSTYGVARLIMRRSNEPQRVPTSVMQTLMECIDGDGNLRQPTPLSKGDTVRITTGPMADLVGRVTSLADDQRVHVLLEIMGQAVRTEVPRQTLLRRNS